MIRDAQFYDFIAQGLASMGYVDGGHASLQMYLDDMFAEKWNAEATYAQMGFPLDPDIRLNPTYEQIEAVIRPYTMAAYVDYDSDGPSKSVDGATLKTGEIKVGGAVELLEEEFLTVEKKKGNGGKIYYTFNRWSS